MNGCLLRLTQDTARQISVAPPAARGLRPGPRPFVRSGLSLPLIAAPRETPRDYYTPITLDAKFLMGPFS
jgi:hypothetical protein